MCSTLRGLPRGDLSCVVRLVADTVKVTKRDTAKSVFHSGTQLKGAQTAATKARVPEKKTPPPVTSSLMHTYLLSFAATTPQKHCTFHVQSVLWLRLSRFGPSLCFKTMRQHLVSNDCSLAQNLRHPRGCSQSLLRNIWRCCWPPRCETENHAIKSTRSTSNYIVDDQGEDGLVTIARDMRFSAESPRKTATTDEKKKSPCPVMSCHVM